MQEARAAAVTRTRKRPRARRRTTTRCARVISLRGVALGFIWCQERASMGTRTRRRPRASWRTTRCSCYDTLPLRVMQINVHVVCSLLGFHCFTRHALPCQRQRSLAPVVLWTSLSIEGDHHNVACCILDSGRGCSCAWACKCTRVMHGHPAVWHCQPLKPCAQEWAKNPAAWRTLIHP